MITVKHYDRDVRKRLDQETFVLANRMANRVVENAKREAPKDTGELVRSHFYTVTSTSRAETRNIGYDEDKAPYGINVYHGHGWIYPKKAKVLHWVKNGKDVFARAVRPVAPNRWLDRAMTRTKGQLGELIAIAREQFSKI